ncbi:MAG: hypothetical protein R3D62_13865 [Xanthobacteraceae bacterium]
MRLLNLIVAAALVLAAGYVYKSKFAATVEAERVAKLRTEIARERDLIAALRAESAKLETPVRIQGLAQRHLPLKPLNLEQIDTIDAVPFPPIEVITPPSGEPVIAKANSAAAEFATGSVRAPTPADRPVSAPVASRHAGPTAVVRKPAPPVAAIRPAPRAIVARPDPAFGPLRPPADVWTGGGRPTAGPR